MAFTSRATNLVPGDTNGTEDVFVHDREGLTERVSIHTGGAQGDARSFLPALSGDGRFVAFSSQATNLVSDDTNTCGGFTTPDSCPDVFVHDRQTGL